MNLIHLLCLKIFDYTTAKVTFEFRYGFLLITQKYVLTYCNQEK